MSEDTIQRPKGRHSSDTYSEEPEQKERKPLFGRKGPSDAEAPETQTKRRLFGRRQEDVSEPEPQTGYEPSEPEPASTRASINLAGASTAAPEVTGYEDAMDQPSEKRGMFQRKVEDRKGTWGDRDYSASDAEAHRDVRYSIPSPVSQTITMFMVQMRLYFKSSSVLVFFILAVLIPIILAVLPEWVKTMLISECADSNAYLGALLAMMPLFLGLFSAIICGPTIGREFKDRTAYMNVSLPMSRVSFYIGKYLAGFVICLGIFILAYSMSLIALMGDFDLISGDLVIRSLMVTVVALFAFTATTYCLGAFSKKPTSMMPFMVLVVLLPLLLLMLKLRFEMDWLMMLPVFLPDLALILLGSPFVGSVHGFFKLMGISYVSLSDLDTMLVIGVVWSVVFLALGLYRTLRREM